MAATHMAISCLTIPRVAHVKLYKLCIYMFHAMRKHGPRKHVMGMHCRFLVATGMDTHGTVKL